MTLTSEEFIKLKEKELPKEIKTKDISRKGIHKWAIVKRICMQQTGLPEKIFVFERLKRLGTEGEIIHKINDEGIQYRIGYYIVGKNGKKNGKWVWGQFCPLIPDKDFDKLIEKAKQNGIFSD